MTKIFCQISEVQVVIPLFTEMAYGNGFFNSFFKQLHDSDRLLFVNMLVVDKTCFEIRPPSLAT